MGLKSEKDIITHSMAEDDPNQNQPGGEPGEGPRWGPTHAGAKELASQYTFGNITEF